MRVHNIPPPVPILNQTNPVHTIPPYFFKSHFNSILPSMPKSSIQSFSFTFSNRNLICILMLVIISPVSCYFISLMPSILLCILVWNTFSSRSLISVRKKYHTHKSKVFPVHSMKAYTGKRGVTPLWTWALDEGKWLTSCPGHSALTTESQHPMNTRLGGPPSQSGYFGDDKNPLHVSGFEPQMIQNSTTSTSNGKVIVLHILNFILFDRKREGN